MALEVAGTVADRELADQRRAESVRAAIGLFGARAAKLLGYREATSLRPERRRAKRQQELAANALSGRA